jgi:hypothetical protein
VAECLRSYRITPGDLQMGETHMKTTMWLALTGILVGAATLPAGAAPLGVDGLKTADADAGTTLAGYRHRHRWHGYYPRYRPYYYNYYYNEPYYGYYRPYYRHYYRPYRHHYGPSFGIYFGGHRGWRGHW